MKRIVLLTLALFSLFGTMDIGAQSSRKANRAYETFEAGEYNLAIDLLKDAYNQTNDKEEKSEIVYLIAECFSRTDQPRKAAMWYNKAILRGYSNPEVYLEYAETLKKKEEYEEAIMEYQRYIDLVPDDPRGELGIRSCELAMEWMANPNGYQVEEMRFFNSKESDFSPTYAREDYGVVYFTSSRDGSTGNEIHGATNENFTDIYSSTVDRKGSWSEPVPLDENVNSEFEDGTPVVTQDYNTMYFTRCRISKNKNMGCEIHQSKREGETWSKSRVLPLGYDSLVFAHPAISADQLTLYFVSDMEGSLGETDIWQMTRSSVTTDFTGLKNLGEQINTPGKEAYPYVHPDGTLYFASNGHIGMGGLDIFKATQNPDGTWEVENMRYPINSAADDFGITFEEDIERGYFSSSRSTRGDDNIYMFLLPPLRFNVVGTIRDEKTDEPIANAIVKSISSEGVTLETTTGEDGEYRFMLSPATDYLFIASAEGYLNGKERETTKGLNESRDFQTDILLSSIEKPIELPNIIYDFNKWDLRPESMVMLDRLIETLNDNPNITIELISHTDARGTKESNLELSQKRAQSAVDYLIQNGIAKDRLTPRGYGETQPRVVDKKTAEQVGLFKEGDVLTEEFIENLDSEVEKETAHQLNRRTEFRVLRTDYLGEE
ncbi:MAG: OmpA family protein [Bacteroidota bacterium]